MLPTRRHFLKLATTAAAGWVGCTLAETQAASLLQTGPREYRGSSLSGWVTTLGDGNYAAPGEPPVDSSDIETRHYGDYSELRANIHRRRIGAHNITYKQIADPNALNFVHTCEYRFRLPYMPSTSNTDLNPQTIEGGVSIWDGAITRLKHEVLFQWILNPWWKFGDIQSWTGTTGHLWQTVGYLAPDTNWHQVRIVADFQQETSSLAIDGVHYPSCLGKSTAPAEWGSEIAAGIQAEIISLYPGESANGTLHMAHFKDWAWVWEPQNVCRTYLPLLGK